MMNDTLELVVFRRYKKAGYTIGDMYVDGKWFCNTLEPQWRDYENGAQKEKGESAIPEGRYEVREVLSPRRKMFVPQLVGVPMFEAIQIHPGNTKKDTEGCILVGYNEKRGEVLRSRLTYTRLFEKLKTAWSVHMSVYVTVIS